jgi:thioredoxin reductase (NADPH)
MNMETRNVLIIGSGPAGYTAAIYAARANLKPLVIGGFIMGGQSGGQLMTTSDVENYPGFPEGIMGPELMDKFRKQAERYGAEVLDKDVVKVDFSKRPFRVWTDETEHLAQTVIISTGATARRLKNEAENRFWNKGISACATCDGSLPIFRNKPIAVIGGGDTAMEEANYLTRFGSQVIIVHRRAEFRASPIMLERARKNPKIAWKVPYVLEDTGGKSLLENLKIRNLSTDQVEDLPANGLFLAIGHEPNTGIFKGQIDLDAEGYIKTDGHTRTSVPGVFASGDCVDKIYRQAVTAAGLGCMSALQAERFLEAEGH